MNTRKRLIALGATASIAMLGQVATPGPVFGGTAAVKATGNDTWSPASKAVPKGTKVVWKNPSGENHNLASYRGAWSKSASLPEGGSTSFKFGKTGTFKYRCTLHSKMEGNKCDGMCGKIVVR